ncbi:MAG: hypothetical protein IAE97_04960 [Chthoniobacterales bacterium]|nr:hypothetical protein [Chthoniobacterales bacterium]
MKTYPTCSVIACAAILLLVAGVPRAAALLVSLNPSADTFITDGNLNGASSTANYGSLGAIAMAGASSGNGGEYLALFKFDLSSAVSQFDAEFGLNNWSITSVTLRLASNFGTQGAVPNNAVFPTVNGGPFSILWFSDDSWTETGVTYANFAPGSTEGLGSFNYVPPGNNIPVVWTLNLRVNFLADMDAGGDVSLQLAPGNDAVSYVFNSRTFNTAANHPVLAVTAVPEPDVAVLLLPGAAAVLIAGLRRRSVR